MCTELKAHNEGDLEDREFEPTTERFKKYLPNFEYEYFAAIDTVNELYT